MARKVIAETDAIVLDNIVVGIYGMPNVGKTSVTSSLDTPVLFDFDKGVHRAGAFRRHTWQFDSWVDVVEATNANDLAPFKTIVLDTIGRAAQLIIAYIVERELAKDKSHLVMRTGQLTQSGYGELGNVFRAWLNLCRSLNKDVVWIGHAKEDGTLKDGDLTFRVIMPGSSKDEITQSSDVIAYMYQDKSGRHLEFSYNPHTVSKDIGLGKIKVPHLTQEPDFLAGVVARAKQIVFEESSKRVQEGIAFKERLISHALEAMAQAKTFQELNAAGKSIPAHVRLTDDEKHSLRTCAESNRQRLLAETNKEKVVEQPQASQESESTDKTLIDRMTAAKTVEELDCIASEIELCEPEKRTVLRDLYDLRLAKLTKQSA